MKTIKFRSLIYLGFFIPIIFWGTTILTGLMTNNYNHLTNLVSELGAIGTKTQYIFTTGLALSGVLTIFFIIGLYKTAKENRINTIPIILLIAFSFSIFCAGIFPLPNRLHGILGSPSMILPLSPLLALILWKQSTIRDIKLASLIICIIMSLGFLALFPNLLEGYSGLKQRLFHAGWTIWFLYLSRRFLELKSDHFQDLG